PGGQLAQVVGRGLQSGDLGVHRLIRGDRRLGAGDLGLEAGLRCRLDLHQLADHRGRAEAADEAGAGAAPGSPLFAVRGVPGIAGMRQGRPAPYASRPHLFGCASYSVRCYRLLNGCQRSSESTFCEAWLACDSIDVPAWVRIWLRVKETISCAMSVSRMRDSDAERFSTATLRLLMVCSNRFWTAPSDARRSDTVWMAASMVSIAPEASVSRSSASVANSVALISSMGTSNVSPLFAPIWNA